MARPAKPALPLLDGVSASAVACPPGPWPLVLDFLAERLPKLDRKAWHARLLRGEVLGAQGQPLASDAPYEAGARLYYYRALDHEEEIPFTEQIVFQDERLLVADKPHFLPVTPKGRYVQQTLLTRLIKRTGLASLSPIHRIDRETAGLVLFAIQPSTRDAYQRLFRERSVSKGYEAIAPYRDDPALPRVYRSRLEERADAFMQMHEVPGEPNAETEIALIEHAAGFGRYALKPHTGRKHQLRAHMNALGLPIVGDRIYPRLLPEEATPDYSAPLQLLAREVSFTDPVTGQPRHFESAQRLRIPTPGSS
ncbi:MAG TPA: pseudouridine synthase [Burkholderiaceae bacterium]|jgi:tRNA pseudouridine32 synthase/23S rRNA pseudouridine746 synthase